MAGRFDAIFGRDRILLFDEAFFISSRISLIIEGDSLCFDYAMQRDLGYLAEGTKFLCRTNFAIQSQVDRPKEPIRIVFWVALLGALSILAPDRTIRRPLILYCNIFFLLYPIRDVCRELVSSSSCRVQFLPDSKQYAICTFHHHDLDAQGHVPSPTTTHLMACIVSYKRAAYGCAESSDFKTPQPEGASPYLSSLFAGSE